jgi:hypothetical protein
MRKATKYDKGKVVNILTRTFDAIPGVNWMLKKSGNHERKIRRLANYAVTKALLRDGVYISSNEKGVALCFKYNLRVVSFTKVFYQIKFVLLSVKLNRILRMMKLELYKERSRPRDGEYLYFWFFGVLKDGNDAAFELKNAIFRKSFQDNLPIYLETSLERNQYVYEKYGFKTYHYWEDKEENIQFWFMKREP